MGKQVHNFVKYYNPRNGRVSIQACAKCGIAKGFEVAQRHCNLSNAHENKMHAAGWHIQQPDTSLVAAA